MKQATKIRNEQQPSLPDLVETRHRDDICSIVMEESLEKCIANDIICKACCTKCQTWKKFRADQQRGSEKCNIEHVFDPRVQTHQ